MSQSRGRRRQGNKIFIRVSVFTLFGALLIALCYEALMVAPVTHDIVNWLGPLVLIVNAAFILPIVWKATRPPLAKRKEFIGAPVGVGTLVSAYATGSTLNDQPQMKFTVDVETLEGRTFRTTIKEYVNIALVSDFVPGATVPVLYLPNNKIAFAPVAHEEQLAEVLYQSRMRQGKLTEQQVHVAKLGLSAKAVVMQLQPTGEIGADEAVMRIKLRVTRPDGSTFDSHREMPVPGIALPGLQPGSAVEVKYIPSDESYVAVSTRVR
ncbi:hypothetical protein JOF28_000192 [Leucobacter exalbidus]|uniref:Uncharacterized protein n=1 Tax=Leucobacter exalbidus TaxID=662960 RepID=A0A940SZJ5_9MICO|nr:hypothetical protein [Leucobacter exalbidus]MBP1324960.1 hypothetical protein [Leucobacter exalbidus]